MLMTLIVSVLIFGGLPLAEGSEWSLGGPPLAEGSEWSLGAPHWLRGHLIPLITVYFSSSGEHIRKCPA
jgi:hypothetical protein